ncbi:prolyl oligopeptidase family serine peptidase [Aliidiomarina celeris]|uniref:prolyl oligopeptidase family serine peptidase n=1 Tax=Aliidiomarina celeris TaxID=2249428 RepID=UPI001E52FBB5|nr:prolyl oligopeptidase family serine peptidase [Aliidiomarina celeris]
MNIIGRNLLISGLFFFALFMIVSCAQRPAQDTTPPTGLEYPYTPESDQNDKYHGVDVADPYRWLENLNSTEVQQWVASQNAFTRNTLNIRNQSDTFKQRLTDLWNYERIGTPFRHGDRYFYYRNDGLQNQSVLYVTDHPGNVGKALIDPNGFSNDGTVALADAYVSPQGNYVAYGVSDGGSDWRSFRIRNVQTGRDLADEIRFTKFTNIAWLADETGFYYSRYPTGANTPNGDDQQPVAIYFHRLGTAQQNDPLIYSIADNSNHNPYPRVTRDGRFLVAVITDGFFANAIHIKELGTDSRWVRLFDDWQSQNELIDTDGNLFFFKTNNGAETGRVIAVDIRRPAAEHWQELIAAQTETLTNVSYVGGKFFAHYLRNAQSVVHVHDAFGRFEKQLELPDIGTVSGFTGNANHLETFFSLTGFTNPGTVYRYDIRNDITEVHRRTQFAADLSDFTTEQVFYESKDGTRIPMFLVYQKGLQRNGKNSVLLYGYGGFDISLTPSFSAARIAWIEQGGVLAIPNLRGGGEYGAAWHRAGTQLQKQNTFDDFIAAAEWLINANITAPEHLAIQGGSNGGLLVGAAMTQRPELFAAALPAVGVLDMLRYHVSSANARAWSSDYGLSEDPEHFANLYAYSPVHNTQAGTCYPATLITTGDHDDRVMPWHSYKFTAVLQRDQGCEKPILLKVETRAGHGAGTPIWMRIEQIAEQWAFAFLYTQKNAQEQTNRTTESE